MKKIIDIFKIDEKKIIEFYFPDIKNKFNYYYKPTKKLHQSDEITVSYKSNNHQIVLFFDIVDWALHGLKKCLKSIEKDELELPPFIDIGEMNYHLGESSKEFPSQLYEDFSFGNYWVWSMVSGGAQTFMYTSNGQIYLEIGLSYPWNYEDAELDPNYITIEEFLKDYKPLVVEKISHEIAQQWLVQCEKLIKKIGTDWQK